VNPGKKYSQLGWLQMYRPECDSANATDTRGCWCARSDWDDPTGDGYVYRLTGFIPIEWTGANQAGGDERTVYSEPFGQNLNAACVPKYYNQIETIDDSKYRKEPPNRYSDPAVGKALRGEGLCPVLLRAGSCGCPAALRCSGVLPAAGVCSSRHQPGRHIAFLTRHAPVRPPPPGTLRVYAGTPTPLPGLTAMMRRSGPTSAAP
jgi:hypothetical protein